jgi:hypothetical protein
MCRTSVASMQRRAFVSWLRQHSVPVVDPRIVLSSASLASAVRLFNK